MAIKIIKGGVSKAGQKSQTEEAKMIQEIYDGLSKMEQRIDSLETIILDSKREDKIP